MSQPIWFGNRRYMQWVKSYAASPAYGRSRFEVSTDYDNGGVGVDQSLDGSRTYALSWNVAKVDELEFLDNYASGVYGPEPINWTDPMYARRNAATASWSMPWMAAEDALPLILRERPTMVPNPDTSFGYPPFSARYNLLASDTSRVLPVPIPPGYTAWVGVHSDDSLATDIVKVTEFEALVGGAVSHPVLLGMDTPTLVNTSFASSGGQSWIEIEVDLSDIGPSETRTVDLNAIVVQVIPTGDAPSTGRFRVGRGHSGCRFNGFPSEDPYSAHADLDTTTYTVKLVETGAWE